MADEPNSRRRSAVYLHYLDRELNEASGRPVQDLDAVRWTRLLALLTTAELYCGLSAIWENDDVGPRAREDFRLLYDLGHLETLSHDTSQGAFKESRQTAYQHDRDRYPNYFSDTGERLSWLHPTRIKSVGSTVPLVTHLTRWSEKLPNPEGRYSPAISRLRKPMRAALLERGDQAVTFSYFHQFLGDLAERIPGPDSDPSAD